MAFGIMTCRGVVESTDSGVVIFKFVFEIPEGLGAPLLRSLLVSSRGQRCPLYPPNECFELARQLSRLVMFVHSSNMAHKNIRPRYNHHIPRRN